MKYLLLMLCLAASSCSHSPAERWQTVTPGQSFDEVREIMGHSDHTSNSGGVNALYWKIDDFQTCGVTMTKDWKVDTQFCNDDSAGRQAYANQQRAAAMMYLQSHPIQNTYQPMPVYQMPIQRNYQSNCTTQNMGGGMFSTNCNTR